MTVKQTEANLMVRSGMYPLYLCAGCSFTPMSDAGEICNRCRKGRPAPTFEWIRDFPANARAERKSRTISGVQTHQPPLPGAPQPSVKDIKDYVAGFDRTKKE